MDFDFAPARKLSRYSSGMWNVALASWTALVLQRFWFDRLKMLEPHCTLNQKRRRTAALQNLAEIRTLCSCLFAPRPSHLYLRTGIST